MNWGLAAGSLAAVLALAGVARLLKLGGAPQIEDSAAAIRHAEAQISGFDGRCSIVSIDRTLAVVAGGPGEAVVIEPMGARLRARHFTGVRVATAQRAPEGTTLTLALSDREMWRITVADGAASGALIEALGD